MSLSTLSKLRSTTWTPLEDGRDCQSIIGMISLDWRDAMELPYETTSSWVSYPSCIPFFLSSAGTENAYEGNLLNGDIMNGNLFSTVMPLYFLLKDPQNYGYTQPAGWYRV